MSCLNPETGSTLADFGYSLGRYFIPVDYSGIISNAVNSIGNIIVENTIAENIITGKAAVENTIAQTTITINSWLILPYLLGKIPISYGYVEVVQAFRTLK